MEWQKGSEIESIQEFLGWILSTREMKELEENLKNEGISHAFMICKL